MSNSKKTTVPFQENTNELQRESTAESGKSRLSGPLIFWIVFWPSFLLALLLNAVRIHYDISDERGLIVAFAIYIPVSTWGIFLALKKLH